MIDWQLLLGIAGLLLVGFAVGYWYRWVTSRDAVRAAMAEAYLNGWASAWAKLESAKDQTLSEEVTQPIDL
jgi:hypothetical protein